MSKLFLRCFEIDITDKCNLNCAGCSHFSPLTEHPFYYELDKFTSDIKKMSELFIVNEIRLLGGEPFLHPNLSKLVEVVRTYFPNSKLRINTNGLLTERIKAFEEESIKNNYRVTIQVSDYPKVNSKLELSKIDKHIFDHLNFNLTGNSDPEISRSKCLSATCYSLFNGRLYICPIMRNISKFMTYFNLNLDITKEMVSADIYTNSNIEIYNFINNTNLGCSMCKYCGHNHKKMSWKLSSKQIAEWAE